MTATTLLSILLAQAPGPDPKPEAGRSTALLALHEADASQFSIYRDATRTEKLTLRREPVYRWTNPTRNSGQEGDVFLWTYKGRPSAVGCIFTHPEGGLRAVNHEFHSLSESVLAIDRQSANTWAPTVPGLQARAVPDAPTPAASAPARLRQMNAIAREFTGHSRDDGGKRWEFRLLTKPLYRDESTDPAVLDGAVFAFVTSAGTDPEAFLLLEARDRDGRGPRWEYGVSRFSDVELWLEHKNAQVWTAPFAKIQDGGEPTQRYRLYTDRKIPDVVGKDPGRP